MSSVLQNVSINSDLSYSYECDTKTLNNNHIKYVLKSKQRKLKGKCSKALKKKLKKYKLRHDGKEDEDVLDISKTLQVSLKIKSPNSVKVNNREFDLIDIEEIRPRNYLFKMVKRSKKCLKTLILLNQPECAVMQDVKNINTINESVESVNISNKKTNAFKLLMDSRNKSIGSNSPGKERPDIETQDVEKRDIKAKRNLMLQKMVEAKGALKNKEVEELQELIINRKMEKRAERLKAMLTKNESKKSSKDNKAKIEKPVPPVDKPQTLHKEKDSDKSEPKMLQLINIFNEEEKNHKKAIKVSKEDDEFLKKLSPSIKKKENMLSYFKKIDKDSSASLVEDDIFTSEPENDTIIKVKLNSKVKNKSKKKPPKSKVQILEVKEDIENVINLDDDVTLDTLKEQDRKKRKRNTALPTPVDSQEADANDPTADSKQSRPKRCTKRPVKYVDDVEISSSDEELHIFTPKKKKRGEMTAKEDKIEAPKNNQEDTNKLGDKKKVTKEIPINKKSRKLAPIFTAKPPLDAAALEAKQKFLQSGMPAQIKKIISQKKSSTIESVTFSPVCHVQQDIPVFAGPSCKLNLIEEPNRDDQIYQVNYDNLLDLTVDSNIIVPKVTKNSKILLQEIKDLYPKFPVYRTYRLLTEKTKGKSIDSKLPNFDNSIEVITDLIDSTNENPDYLNWTDKYKAQSSNEIIGNFDPIRELRKWLISWTNENKTKNTPSESDSSDFCYSDTESKDSMKNTNNLLILSGPVGCGKTSSIYAVAAELSMKVIEVNASSRRTGKIMLQDLQEATQSHKVNRGKESSQKSQEIFEEHPKKRGRPKRNDSKQLTPTVTKFDSEPSSQDSTRTAMSLILIDDADIIFDQDDGFCTAISQLTHSSKRPVILITTSLTCTHLQRFIQYGKIISLQPLLPRMLGTWLDIMCLVDNNLCWPGLSSKCLDLFKGDIRKTINFLQFYVSSHPSAKSSEDDFSQNSDNLKLSIDDENSSMSWSDKGSVEKINPMLSDTWKYFIEKQMTHFGESSKQFTMWWHLPTSICIKLETQQENSDRKEINTVKLDNIFKIVDAFSMHDVFKKRNIPEDIVCRPWSTFCSDSISENENIDYYNKSSELSDDIADILLTSSITEAERSLQCDLKTDLHFPRMTIAREKERNISRHNSLTNCLNPSAVLDRKALALDYWSTCRTICRVEKNRTDTSSRRNNRFCHYLKSLNVFCKNDSYDKLAESLSLSDVSKLDDKR